MSDVNEELRKKANLGERASRLIEGGDLAEFIAAYDAMIAEQEQALAPLDTNSFTILRAGRRIMHEFLNTFLEGVKAEGEMARAEQQGITPDKRIIL